MAVTLRLRPDAADALRAEAERTGLSQQTIVRRALDEYLEHRIPTLAPAHRKP
jgi:hypothetical protein